MIQNVKLFEKIFRSTSNLTYLKINFWHSEMNYDYFYKILHTIDLKNLVNVELDNTNDIYLPQIIKLLHSCFDLQTLIIYNSDVVGTNSDIKINLKARFSLKKLKFHDCNIKNFELKHLADKMAENASLKENVEIQIQEWHIMTAIYNLKTLEILTAE